MGINFFTAIKYEESDRSFSHSLLEIVDNYFYLGGKKAHVIQSKTKDGKQKAVLADTDSSILARVAKVVSYFTVVIPTFLLVAKLILRSTHSFKIIDPKLKLEKGMNIPADTIVKLQRLMAQIEERGDEIEDKDTLVWLSRGNNLIFKLVDAPNLVFKMAPPHRSVARGGRLLDAKAISEERFANMIKAKGVCLTHQLGQLIIPHAKKVDIKVNNAKYTLIAEETLDFNPTESAQEELYHQQASQLNETVRQLATFVAKTQFNDVAWRNIPILNEAPEFQGSRRVGLIDLEHMDNGVTGFTGERAWGGNGSRGLIACVSEEQIGTVIEEANKQVVNLPEGDIQEAKESRLKELESNQQLREFYERKGIRTGKEPIQVDVDTLDLNLTEEGQISVRIGWDETNRRVKWEKQKVTLRQAAEQVIAKINTLLQESSDQASIKGKRYFLLDREEDLFNQYDQLGFDSNKPSKEEQEKHIWLRRIIRALIDKGHLFKLDKINGYGLYIQA
ncbi:DUF648 domain-containing protein [Candidatus Protochlamydia phocaeensis]|uniref:DUF648 domain-containing protein n=1 Tax=Candidatus Protochlamydia phocaeensis TaxID=1414722 RepID=UPI00083813CC|nr:DUF648 domain-containing protein [Candidatus Protochlamydia phocaeensis]